MGLLWGNIIWMNCIQPSEHTTRSGEILQWAFIESKSSTPIQHDRWECITGVPSTGVEPLPLDVIIHNHNGAWHVKEAFKLISSKFNWSWIKVSLIQVKLQVHLFCLSYLNTKQYQMVGLMQDHGESMFYTLFQKESIQSPRFLYVHD